MGILKAIKQVFSSKEERIFNRLIDLAIETAQRENISYWSIKPNELPPFQELLALSDKEKVDFIKYAVEVVHKFHQGRTSFNGNDPEFIKSAVVDAFYQHLLRTKLVLDEADVAAIVTTFTSHTNGHWRGVMGWPLGLLVNQVEKNFREKKISGAAKQAIEQLQSALNKQKTQLPKDLLKVLTKIETLLFESEHDDSAIQPIKFIGADQLAAHANPAIEALPSAIKPHFYKVLAHAQSANGSKPSTKYLDQSAKLIKELGADKFKAIVLDWFDFVIHLKEIEEQHTQTYNGRQYTYTTRDFLSAPNIDALKGFVWMCAQFHDARTLQTIAQLAERSFRKIPSRGPAAASIGNACLFTLFKSKGLDGIAHLSRLRLRIKQNSTQNLIEKYLQEAAKQQGVSVYEIEDLAADDYGLVNGSREYVLDDYKLVLTIKGVGDVEQSWFKPDGNPQKSVPSVVKEKFKEKLAKIKNTVKQIELSTSAQRDRIDRMLRSERIMTWAYFEKHYFHHGLIGFLARNIIWQFKNDKDTFTVIYQDDTWRLSTHESVVPAAEWTVSLWHPITATVSEVQKWRNYLIEQKVQQPIKQAFREVYFLTDAEVNTRTYSNRMAAHILKQHQFNSLAKTRGWKYSLLGAYDDGRSNEAAQLYLPEFKLRAEYWINEVNADDAFNEMGIWNYVATDQVRFVSLENDQPINLVDVPRVPFTEVMRDVDLFVGVASVGNDPTWNDSGGVPAYRDYWQSYSFGELSEVAKNRKEMLERLIPRLKIAAVSSIKDRFLVVKGKLRTYKIHMGSTNILMEPNDQYLCIVPDRSQKPTTDNLFLPFEGDNGLSVILSKAMLLADDDKITDSTILTQINRR